MVRPHSIAVPKVHCVPPTPGTLIGCHPPCWFACRLTSTILKLLFNIIQSPASDAHTHTVQQSQPTAEPDHSTRPRNGFAVASFTERDQSASRFCQGNVARFHCALKPRNSRAGGPSQTKSAFPRFVSAVWTVGQCVHIHSLLFGAVIIYYSTVFSLIYTWLFYLFFVVIQWSDHLFGLLLFFVCGFWNGLLRCPAVSTFSIIVCKLAINYSNYVSNFLNTKDENTQVLFHRKSECYKVLLIFLWYF